MANETYDRLKILSVILSAAGTLYLTFAQIWGLPYGEQIAASVGAVVTFLLAVLKVSSDKYKKYIEEDEEGEG